MNRTKRRKRRQAVAHRYNKHLSLNPFLVSIVIIILLLLTNVILKPKQVEMVEQNNIPEVKLSVWDIAEEHKIKAEPTEEEILVKEKIFAHKQAMLNKKMAYFDNQNVDMQMVASRGIASREDRFVIYDLKLSEELQAFTYTETQKCQDIDYELVLAVLFTESRFNPKAKGYNDNGTVDQGIAQINSRYEDSYAELTQLYDEFNPYISEHGIMACAYKLQTLADVWKKEGITDKDMLELYTIQSYNRGVIGFKNYIAENGTPVSDYSYLVFSRRNELETTGTIIEK